MIAFDHLRLITGQPSETKRFRGWVLAAQPGDVSQLAIVHEANGDCCRRERWNITAGRIIAALKPTVPQVLVNLTNPLEV